MAYSTLLSLENAINRILDQDRFSVSIHGKKEIISVKICVLSFQAFLEDFPDKAKNLEARIRDVAAEAEDIIEWFLEEQIHYNHTYTKWTATLRGIMFPYQLHKVRNEMDLIAAEVVEIKNSTKAEDSIRATSPSQVADTGKVDAVGFNKDLLEMKDKLLGCAKQLQVLPITGMGGIGKTTLARNVYDDQLIIENFKVRVWITISQDYSERRILLHLLDSMKEFEIMEENSKSELAQRFESTAEHSAAMSLLQRYLNRAMNL